MAKLICKKCGYKVEGENIRKCPYCGEMSLKEEQNAEELIQDVDKVME